MHALTSEFERILDEISNLHSKKGQDYGTTTNPFANIYASADFGVRPWVGAVLRANDKMARIKAFVRKGNLVNESVEDSLLDAAVYFIIALAIYRHEQSDGPST